MNQLSLSPHVLPGSFPEGVISPRRARALTAERPMPFLVDPRDEAAAAGAVAATSPAGIRLVFGGYARRPVFIAGVVALAGVTGIGLFLGLMLGEFFG